MLTRDFRLIPVALFLAVAGCASPPASVTKEPVPPGVLAKEPAAKQAALQRGRADLACPSAEVKVISAQRLRPNFTGPMITTAERAEFIVEASGCGKGERLRVVCAQDNTECYVADATAK